MNKIKLSVCIPTYNRASCLRQCLGSITGQFTDENVRSSVEIVISDNASSDETNKVVKEFMSLYTNIIYVKNDINLGFDKNVLQCVEKANGDFCWLLGDDDALFDGALAAVLGKINQGKWPYMLVNCWGYDNQLKAKAMQKPNLDLQHDLVFASLSEFVIGIKNMKNTVGYFGGMSGQIFKRTIWQSLGGKEQFIDSQAIHLFVLLKAFKNLPFIVVAEPLVKARASNIRWDTFPGLETFYGRALKTHKTLLWILDTYQIKYSKIRLNIYYYTRLATDWSLGCIKKVFFTQPFVRSHILPKVKLMLGK